MSSSSRVKNVTVSKQALTVQLTDGRVVSVPLEDPAFPLKFWPLAGIIQASGIRPIMSPITRALCCLLALCGPASLGGAEEGGDAQPAIDKSAFNFFNPTPPALLRELSIDGPGATESPYTVDAGHFQIELTLVDYTSESDTFGGVPFRFDELDVAPMTLKVGLLNSLDLQLVLEPYIHQYQREEVEGERTQITRSGFGNTTLRLKYNLWGNDRGPTALALTPFVTFPTRQDGVDSDIIEGGLVVPFAAKLPWDFLLGLTSRFSTAQDIIEGTGRHEEFGNSILLAHPLLANLEPYVEFFSNVSTEKDVGLVTRFDTGLQWWLTDDLQLNAGMNVGLTKWADDWDFFAGLAWRY